MDRQPARRIAEARETIEALQRVDSRSHPSAEDIAHLHDVHADHERGAGREDRAAAAEERARHARERPRSADVKDPPAGGLRRGGRTIKSKSKFRVGELVVDLDGLEGKVVRLERVYYYEVEFDRASPYSMVIAERRLRKRAIGRAGIELAHPRLGEESCG